MLKKQIFSFLFLAILLGGCGILSKSGGSQELQSLFNSLSCDERQILKDFFYTLFKESQGGYVLYGNKPICIESFPIREEGSIFLPQWMHVSSLKFKRGALLWKKLDLNKYARNYALFIYERPVFDKWVDFILINKQELLKTIASNITLFQYVLGPKVTPDQLLASLTDPHETFQSVLHDDRVLIGILLGYGTQNALLSSRLENIQESPSVPTFGFTSLNEEASWLAQGRLVSVNLSQTTPLLPWFGCYDNRETEILIHGYKRSQQKIAKVLQSERFLEQVLTQFFDCKVAFRPPSTLSYKSPFPNKHDMAQIVAQSIWHSIDPKLRDQSYLQAFCKGMVANEAGIPPLSDGAYNDLASQFIDTFNETTPSDPSCLSLRTELGYSAGLKVWDHFKQGREFYVFSDILKYLKDASAPIIAPIDLATDELLVALHLVLYEKTKESVH